MADILDRSGASRTGEALACEHFQMAYVTNDSDAACELLAKRLGIEAFTRLEGENPAGGYVRADFAWCGGIMYEVIHACGPGTDVFATHMPAGRDLRLVHHHLGFLLRDDDERHAVLASARDIGCLVLGEGINSLVQVFFVKVPGLDHYLEYLLPTEAGLQFFNSVARS